MVSVVFDSHDTTLYVGTSGGSTRVLLYSPRDALFYSSRSLPCSRGGVAERSPIFDVFWVFTKKMSRNIVVKSIKTGFSAELPTDWTTPGIGSTTAKLVWKGLDGISASRSGRSSRMVQTRRTRHTQRPVTALS